MSLVQLTGMIEVDIVKVYSYRTAMLRNHIPFPREIFRFVEDSLESKDKDNNIIVIANVYNKVVWERMAFWFSDGYCYVAKPECVVEKENSK